MRKGRVSTPVSSMKALNGDRQGPVSRRPTALQRMAKPKSPKVSANRTPWYALVGCVIAGNLSFWNQSKVPPSTTMPPMELP